MFKVVNKDTRTTPVVVTCVMKELKTDNTLTRNFVMKSLFYAHERAKRCGRMGE